MPSQPYGLVKDDHDNPDLKIPVHAEQMFYQGIRFQAKVSERGAGAVYYYEPTI